MREQKHTPGPWVAIESKDFGGNPIFHITQADGAPFTQQYSDVATARVETISGEVREIQQANAILIAAAPDLLEALHDLIEYAGVTTLKAEAAIAKAEGKQ